MNPPDAQSTALTHGEMLTAISDGLVALLTRRRPDAREVLGLGLKGPGGSASRNRGSTMTVEGIDCDVGPQRAAARSDF
jgi:hypothetical protein